MTFSTRNKSKPKAKLAKQLVKAILGFYLAIALAMTVAQIAAEYVLEKQRLTGRVADMAATFSPSLAQGLWTFDDEQINASLSGAFKIAEIHGVKVTSNEGSTWVIGNYLDTQEQLTFAGEDNTKNLSLNPINGTLYQDQFSISREGDVLGNQVIYYSANTLVSNLWIATLITLLLALLKTLVLWVITVWVANRLIANPLLRVSEGVKGFDLTSTEYSGLALHSPDDKQNELTQLSKSITQMTSQLAHQNRLVANNTLMLEEQVGAQTEALAAKNKRLEKALRAKKSFLEIVSHELRTPLNGVHGGLQILRKNSDPGNDELISSIIASSTRLNELITDLLNYSEADSGSLKLKLEPIQLSALLNEIECTYAPLAQKKGLGFNVQCEQDGNEPIMADRTHLLQAITKLVDNAIKFTKQGQVNVDAKISTHQFGEPRLTVAVRDTGIGFSPDDYEKIFERFVQLDDRATREYQGVGLGLSTCKQLAKLMGATIRVKSTPGEGTTFTFALPLTIEQDTPTLEADNLRTDLSILVVDDVPTNVMMLQFMVEDLGFKVLTASNGEEAVDMYSQHSDQILCVLMDYHMPVMNGLEATRAILESHTNALVYAVTASDLDSTRAECKTAGMVGFIAKPVD